MTEGDRSRTAYLLFGASFLLAVGSFTLLLGPVLIVFLRWSPFLIVLTGVAASLLHFLAWIVLGYAIVALMRSPGPWPRDARWGMTAAFLISLLGFGIAFVGTGPGSFALLPYLPAIYVPVIAAHGVIFLIGAGVLVVPEARKTIVGGGLFLLGVAAVSVVVSPMPSLSNLLFWLPGIGGFGYGIASLGWSWEYRAVTQRAWEGARKARGGVQGRNPF